MLNYAGLENKNVLVVGLAKVVMKLAKLLSKLGANVTVNDGKTYHKMPGRKRFRIYGHFCCKWKSSINIA